METIKIKNVDEEIYKEVLDNGLEVYLYVNNNIHNNYVTFTTKYGSVYNEFIDSDGKNIKVPNGIAHFLEHKVFALKDGPQPEEFYGESGASCNAYTTFKNTTYEVNGSDNLIKNIEFLLDFVQNLYLTKENVESEKGIITQEINMCNDRPMDILYEKIRKNCIKNNPFKDSIIGTEKEVRSITKELLEKCYYKFYNPSNMFLVVTGNFDKDEVIKAIRDNQNNKKFKKIEKIELNKYKEPDKVVKEMEVVKCNTNIPKVAYSIKINADKFKMDKRKISVYLYIIFDLLFGETSIFDEELKKEKISTFATSYNNIYIGSHFVISLVNFTEKYDDFIKKIDNQFKNISIDEVDLERKKRVLKSNEIFSYESISLVNDMIVDNIIYDGKIEDDMISKIDSLNLEELNEIIKNIDFNNKSIVILKK